MTVNCAFKTFNFKHIFVSNLNYATQHNKHDYVYVIHINHSYIINHTYEYSFTWLRLVISILFIISFCMQITNSLQLLWNVGELQETFMVKLCAKQASMLHGSMPQAWVILNCDFLEQSSLVERDVFRRRMQRCLLNEFLIYALFEILTLK